MRKAGELLAQLQAPWGSAPWVSADTLLLGEGTAACVLLQATPWGGEPASVVELYTDGAARVAEWSEISPRFDAAWAVVVMADGQLVGVLGGSLGIASDGEAAESPVPGHGAVDSVHAEAAALLWAMAWSVQAAPQGPFRGARFCFRFDATAVGLVAAGEWQLRADPLLQHQLFHMGALVREVAAADWAHVKGHSGVAGNELADAVAKAVRRGGGPPIGAAGAAMRAFLGDAEAAAWCWLVHAAADPRRGFPPLRGACLEGDLPSDALPPELVESPVPPADVEQRGAPPWISACVVTYNAMTLGDGRAGGLRLPRRRFSSALVNGLAIPGRTEQLEEELHRARVVIAGIQEGRSRTDTLRMGRRYFALRSAGVAGQGGCELWLARDVAIAHAGSDPIFLAACDATVLHADPRCLLVALRNPVLRVDVAVCHAPCEPVGDEAEVQAERWWSELTDRFRARKSAALPLILLIDANGRLGAHESASVGAAGAEPENFNGRHLHELLRDLQLCLPSTFDAVADPPHSTWVSPRGTTSRIDFVAVPRVWLPGVRRAWVAGEMVVGAVQHDHAVVAVQLELAGQARCQPRQWRARASDRSALRDPEVRSLFVQRVQSVPQPAWGNSVHEHCEKWTQEVRRCLQEACGPARRRCRDTFLSAETAAAFAAKRWVQRQLRSARRRGEYMSAAQRSADAPYLAMLRRLEWVLALVVRGLVTLDRNRYVTGLGERVAAASFERAPRVLWQALRAVLPLRRNRRFRAAPLPRLTDAAGVPADSLEARSALWQQHFCGLEAGVVQTVESLARACSARQADSTAQWPDVVELVPADVLTLGQWHAALADSPAGRAAGPDALPAEAFHADLYGMAQGSFPLVMKVMLTAKEPFQHKGGVLQPLWKGVGSQCVTDSYRDILLGDVLGKRLHGGIRRQIMAVAGGAVRPTQCGGVAHRGTDMCALMVREFLADAARSRRSAAVLFAGLKSAYYRAVRETVIGGALHEDVLLNLAQRLGVDRDALRPLLGALDGACVLAQAGVRPHWLRVLREMHSDTWFGVDGCESLVCTRLGTRPGDPFGDMLFVYLMAARLRELERRLAAEEIAVRLPWSSERTIASSGLPPPTEVNLCDVSFADDFAVLLEGPSPEECVRRLRRAAAITADVFEEWGAELNTAPGKSAGLVALRGRGARAVRAQLWVGDAGILSCPRRSRPPLRLHLVHRYKHMGGIVDACGNTLHEVRERASQCADALRALRGVVLRNPGVAPRARAALATSLAGSRLMYNAHAWAVIGAQATTAFETAYMRMLREVAGMHDHREGMATDAAIVAAVPANTPAEALSVARLRFLPRLVVHAPPALLALLARGDAASPVQWKGALALDLAWLGRHTGEAVSGDPEERLHAACGQAAAGPRAWVARVNRAAESARLARRNLVEATLGDETVVRALEAAGLRREGARIACGPVEAMLQELPCPECAKPLRGVVALGVHRYRKHGVVAEARNYVEGTVCEVCLQEFHTRGRLVAHLMRSGACLPQLRVRRAPLAAAEVDKLDAEERLRRRAAGRYDRLAHIPAVRCAGPLVPAAVVPPPLHVRRRARPAVGRWHRLDDSEATHDDEPSEVGYCMEDVEPDGCEAWGADVGTPRLIGGLPAFILHMFSGRRREGDVQAWLETEAFRVPGREVRVVSVDVAIDPVRGNLCDPMAIAKWLRHIAAGVVVGAVGGPPCETWSQVRGTTAGGPPVLRSAADPWGLAGLLPRHLKQVRVATLLLQAFLLVFAVLARSGGVAMLEHPAEPRDPAKCSIWRLAVTRALQRHPAVRRIFVRQGPLGQPAVKPTHLLCLRLPSLQRRLAAEADPAWKPQFVAVGKDATGAWLTTALKEYPPRMCRAIAGAFADSLSEAIVLDGAGYGYEQEIAELQQLVMPLEAGDVGPDFAAEAAAGLPEGPVQWDAIAEAAGVAAVRLRDAVLPAPLRRWKPRGSADRPG